MAAETQAPDSMPANGVAEQHLANGALENGDSEHHGAKPKLTAAERKKLKKKQRKTNKQQQRQDFCRCWQHGTMGVRGFKCSQHARPRPSDESDVVQQLVDGQSLLQS